MRDIHKFINDQLSVWPMACDNFRALKGVNIKHLNVGGLEVDIQFNPARIISSAVKLDPASLAARPCFLCPEHRFPEQTKLRFDGRKGKKYDILLNPYPIFPDHLVVAAARHVPQSIWGRYVDLLDLAKAFPDFSFFYNGPKCGASAPIHHHFQGVGRGRMPLERDIDRLLDAAEGLSGPDVPSPLGYVASVQEADLFHYSRFARGIFVLRGRTVKSVAKLFYRLLDCAPIPEGDNEPRINLFAFHKDGEFRSIVVFRKSHRSYHYFSEGPDHLTMSPGCADMAGTFITPVREDFEKLDNGLLGDLVREVTVSQEQEQLIIKRLTRRQPKVSVGIMSAPQITFEILSDGAGPRNAVFREGKIEYDGALYDELYFGENTLSTMFAQPTFVLHGVTIGKNFHWQRRESQKFAGALKIIVEGSSLTAVNIIGVEDYLVSVISSEMKETASPEFLKAHAVISRSWLMSMISRRRSISPSGNGIWAGGSPSGNGHSRAGGSPLGNGYSRVGGSPSGNGHAVAGGLPAYSIERWYDNSQHQNYDVCADDHCQRYQGLSRAQGERARMAVDATWGEVLTYEGGICDARFSKCCGGRSEIFSSCWDERDLPYLRSLPDTPDHEEGADPFCNTDDREVLAQVLNDYDLETRDFYRWEEHYNREELSALIARRTGIDVGIVSRLEPLETGPSGRITRLLVEGDKGRLTVGKELEIRRILSETHLKSSAFGILYDGQPEPAPGWKSLTLKGSGWGHGVGLCQIGAAVMASRGYDYKKILGHYYPGATISE